MEIQIHQTRLYETLKEDGITLTPFQLNQFESYALLLVEWNKKMNLTSIIEMDQIYEKHFLDSILPSFDTSIKGNLCDVGAGAGFPSIPLKIIYPDLEVTIVEPLGKRIHFLEELCKTLSLSNVILANERAEDFAQNHRETFDCVSARAVANLTMLAELCIPLVKVGGVFLALKGSSGFEEYEDAKYALTLLGCNDIKVYEQTLADDSKRINFECHKTKKTPKAYPRIFSKIKKQPLKGGIR